MRLRVSGRGRPLSARLPAGVVDAGISSLATFIAGLAAVNVLDEVELGAYAIFFTAFVLGQILAYQLIYIPAEIEAVRFEESERLWVLPSSLRIGRIPTLLGASIIFAATLATAPIVPLDVLVALTVTAFLTTWLWPTQDHVRRTLHLAGDSWAAASVSVVLLTVVAGTFGAAVILNVPEAWIPFGTLALANAVSLAFGLFLVQRLRRHSPSIGGVTFRGLATSGKWLLLGESIPLAMAFVTANMITYLASPEQTGFAEAARVAAQPVLVLATGLTVVFRPFSMESTVKGDKKRADRLEVRYLALMLAAGVAYFAFAAGDWPWNPMSFLIPAAYEISGLVAATIAVNILTVSFWLLGQEIVAVKRLRELAALSAIGAPVRVLTSFSAAFVGAFARPISLAAGALVSLIGLVVLRRDAFTRSAVPLRAPNASDSGLAPEDRSHEAEQGGLP